MMHHVSLPVFAATVPAPLATPTVACPAPLAMLADPGAMPGRLLNNRRSARGNFERRARPLGCLDPALEGLVVPSKFYGIAAAGRPTIGLTRRAILGLFEAPSIQLR